MNLRFITLAGFLLLSPFMVASQAVHIDAAEINRYKIVTPSTWYLATDTLVGIDSVTKPTTQSRFRKMPNTGVLFLGYDPHYYWYRLIVANTDTAIRDYVLILGGLGVRKADLWKKKDGQWSFISATGYQYAMEERPYRFAHPSFRLQLDRGVVDTFLMQLDESHSYKSVSFVLVDGATMRVYAHRFYFIMGAMIGLLFLFAIFNVYLFFTINERIHIWYALYVFMMMLFIIKEEGIDPEFLNLDSATGFRMTSMLAISCFAVGFLLQVVQEFLINLQKNGFWFRSLQLMKWFMFGAGAVQLFVFYIEPSNTIEWLVFNVCTKAGIVSFFLIIFSCLYSFYKGFKPAIFLLVGELVFLIGAITRALFVGMSSHVFPPSLFEIGIFIEVIIISYGLMDRYNQYKKDKEDLALELQLQKTKTAEEILSTQEQEQKRIAADLHDELGGNLAAIKMTLESFELSGHQKESLNSLIDKAFMNARHIAHNLMPPDFENTSLHIILDHYYRQISSESKVVFHFYHSGDPPGFSKPDELMIYRIIMELTNNIFRHAQATEATIQLMYGDAELRVMVEDNGRGMGDVTGHGIGLRNLQTRVGLLNGKIVIDSGATGTTIMIHIPYKIHYAYD